MTTTKTTAPSALPPIKIFPAHQSLLRPCDKLAETLTFIGNRLVLLSFPFTKDGRDTLELNPLEVDAIGMEIIQLQDLVRLAEEQHQAESRV